MKLADIISEASLPQYGFQPDDSQTVKVDGIVRPIHNSEDSLIAPTTEGQIAFWRWFRNSKVIDEHGRPRIVFRGDRPGKTEFTGREDPSNYIQGNIFFSSARAVAKGYTPHRTNSYLASKDMNHTHGLYAAYLKIEKPAVMDAKDGDWSRIPLSGRLKKAVGSSTIQIDDLALFVQTKTSYDGLIVKNVWDQFGDGDQLIVFNSQQIKLASG